MQNITILQQDTRPSNSHITISQQDTILQQGQGQGTPILLWGGGHEKSRKKSNFFGRTRLIFVSFRPKNGKKSRKS